MKNIPIYKYIDGYSAEQFVIALNDAERFEEDITVRISTNGGSITEGWAILARLQDFPHGKKLKVDGKALSMGTFMCLYVSDVEALDVSKFMLHKASIPYYDQYGYPEDIQKYVDSINADLKKAMKSKLDPNAFKDAFGVSIDKFFSDDRKDHYFDAKTAKRIGLISSIKTLDSVTMQEVTAFCEESKLDVPVAVQVAETAPEVSNNQNQNKMNIEEVRKHPEIVSQLRAEFMAEAKENASAWMEFSDVDPTAVIAGVATMEAPKASDLAKLQRKMFERSVSPEVVAEGATPDLGVVTPKVGTTPPAEPTASEQFKSKFTEYLDSKTK